MIPAVLSCLYVIYLYRKLHDEGQPGTEAAAPSGSSSVNAAERLASVEQRLSQLVGSNRNKETGP